MCAAFAFLSACFFSLFREKTQPDCCSPYMLYKKSGTSPNCTVILKFFFCLLWQCPALPALYLTIPCILVFKRTEFILKIYSLQIAIGYRFAIFRFCNGLDGHLTNQIQTHLRIPSVDLLWKVSFLLVLCFLL